MSKLKIISVVIILVIIILGFLVYTSSPLMWSKKININQDIIANEIAIKFSKYKRIETVSLELTDKKDCDINLDFYDIQNDSIQLKRTISPSDFVHAKYRMDWYSRNLIIKVSDSLACEKLDVDLVISYWIDFYFEFFPSNG